MIVYIYMIHLEGGSGHEHIARVKWRGTGGTGESTRAEMVTKIRDLRWDVRVSDGRNEAQVGVMDGPPPYLRTYADRTWTNNLLTLPRY